MTDKAFIEALARAKKSKVVEDGSLIIFKDYIDSCVAKMKKNNDLIQRLIGQNDQLKLTSNMLTETLRKYCRMQEDNDRIVADKEAEEERVLERERIEKEAEASIAGRVHSKPVGTPPAPIEPPKKKKSKSKTSKYIEEIDRKGL